MRVQGVGRRVVGRGRGGVGARERSRKPRLKLRLLAVLLALAPGAASTAASAATLLWTGAGGSALWSEAANWSALRAPLDGDELWFGGASPRANSVLDLARSFSALGFTTTAQEFTLHVRGDGASLRFSGAGIVNLTTASSPTRQQLIADAGAIGGSIVFTQQSGLNVGNAPGLRGVDLLALGGTAAAPVGGRLVFQDQSATGTDTYDALRLDGASAPGATGGSLIFRDNALATRGASIAMFGGSVLGARGAVASFEGQARLEGALTVFAGSNGGEGGRAVLSGTAVAAFSTGINMAGASDPVPGAEGVTRLQDNAVMSGSAVNYPATISAGGGGRLEFAGRASHDSSGNDGSLGTAQIDNFGAGVVGARGGATVFMDDAFVRGSRLAITNFVIGDSTAAGTVGGTTEFRDRARAGQVTLINQGARAVGPGTLGGATVFSGQASAENADISSYGGGLPDAPGGTLRFEGSATAAGATLRNDGAFVSGAGSGTTTFAGLSSAGSATIINAAGSVAQGLGGWTAFSGQSGAGTAHITNAAANAGGGAGGKSRFQDDASAQRATIENQGGLTTTDAATTAFSDRATAGNASITNLGGRAAGAFGSMTSFGASASAGAAGIVAAGGGADKALGGIVLFSETATAAGATLDLRSATVTGARGGRAQFQFASSAGSATVLVQGSVLDNVGGPEGASVSFLGTATAADASFAVGGNQFAGGATGSLNFTGTSSAGRAQITLLAGENRGGLVKFEGSSASALASAGQARITNQASATALAHLSIGGQTQFADFSSADRASITNAAGTAFGLTHFFAGSSAGDATLLNEGGSLGQDGGITQFSNTASAQRAVVTNQPGVRGPGGFDAAGQTYFYNQASAGSARITAQGAASAGSLGGLVAFRDNSDPFRSTLIAEGGTGGGGGGRIYFSGSTNASVVRVVLQAGTGPGGAGVLDISGISGIAVGVAIGSLEGAGAVALGGKSLTVGFNGSSTVFSGQLQDGGVSGGTGGALNVVGKGTLTLSGANAYSGGTHIGDGVSASSGKLVVSNPAGSATGTGPVEVRFGGTLSGDGVISGPVVLRAGGTLAPGDPVTLTLQDSLTWDGGGLIRLALGSDTASSDHLNVHSLARGSDGPLVIELLDFGYVVGTSYALMSFDSASGFAADDIQFRGITGSFAWGNGTLAFTPSAVPEPDMWLQFGAGLAGLLALSRRRRTAPSSRA